MARLGGPDRGPTAILCHLDGGVNTAELDARGPRRPGSPRRGRSGVCAAFCAGALLVSGCNADLGSRLPYAGDLVKNEPEAGTPLFEPSDPGPPPLDAGGLCGNLIVPLKFDRPNLYFVLDASGSMENRLADDATVIRRTRYQASVDAIGEVLRGLGHRIRFGAALLPGDSDDATGLECSAGEEIFETTDGDPISFALTGEDGPKVQSLLGTLRRRRPKGPTPTAATLQGLMSTLTALPGETAVVLLTDGAPNCNPIDACPADLCEYHIQGICTDPDVNCCDPDITLGGWRNCVDLVPTRAIISEFLDANIRTYVVGLPGSEFYASVLDELAVAGGTGRPTSPRYIPATSGEELTQTLRRIGANVALSCTVQLDDAPPDPTLVNVYFGNVPVEFDAESGWQWAGAREIQIVGDACERVENGDVLQIQVVAGCPSIVR